jgi:hypothetical protein
VADITLQAAGDECGGLFEAQHGRVDPTGILLAHAAQQANPLDHQPKGDYQEYPGDGLISGKRVGKPVLEIQQDQTQNSLPGPEAVETMRTRRNQRGARDIGPCEGTRKQA